MARSAILSLICLFLSLASPAQEPGSDPDETRVRELVGALDDPDFENREQAFSDLRKLGPDARGLIRRYLDEASIEARLRLENLLEELGGTSREIQLEFETRKIDLVLDGVEIGDALQVITRKTGFRFAPNHGLDEKKLVSLEARDVAPFEVLDIFARTIGQRWTQTYGKPEIRFFRQAEGASPLVSYEGPLRIALESVTLNSSLQIGAEPRHNCYLQGKIDLEPEARVLGFHLQPVLLSAKTESGRSLEIAKPPPTSFQLAGQRRNFHFSIRFQQPEATASKLLEVEAEFLAVVPKRYDEVLLRLEDGVDKPRVETPDTVVQLRSLRKTQAGRTIELRVERKLPQTRGERPTEVADEQVLVTTREGRSLDPIGPIRRRQNPNAEIVTIVLPEDGGEIETILVRSLVEIDERRIRISFPEVPLP